MVKDSPKQPVQISPDVFASLETGNVYQFTDRTQSRTKPTVINVGGYRVIKWGSDNLLPHLNRKILAENDIKQNLINTDVDIAAGQEFYLYTEEIVNGKKIKTPVQDEELEEWLEDIDAHELFTEILQDLKEFGNGWVEFILSRDRSKVLSMMSLDTVDCRLKKNETESSRLDSDTVLVADWKNTSLTDEGITAVPLMDVRKPKLGNETKVAYHVKKRISGMPYYSLVEWYGTKDWTEIANIIPVFHKQGLKNGYMLRYHIKIPKSYFDGKTDKEVEKMKKEIQTQLDSVLAGAENSQKAFYSFINDKLQINGQQLAEWKIEKIETDLKDESYLKLHESASKVHARGHNIDPALAGIQTEGRLSAGAEIRNLLNFHIAYKTSRVRRLALKPINLAKNFNFPDKKDIKIGIIDIEMTTTDESKSGVKSSTDNE